MIDGFLFINKEQGLTSRKVCNQISFKFGEKKVGHIGTLDPFATGLLIVTLGKGNKAGSFLEKSKKTYVAELKLGIKTSTGDCTGDVISSNAVPELNEDSIKEVLETFLGKIKQIPPMTSAIHVNGTKLYKLAHKGIEIERKPRNIEIFNISLLRYENGILDFSCTVSKGTYVRTLGEDIAKALGTLGHLISLRRISIGKWLLHYAKKVDEINEDDILSPDLFLSHSIILEPYPFDRSSGFTAKYSK